MNYATSHKVTLLIESVIQQKLEASIRPELVSQTMSILNNNPNSELVKYIIKRALNPEKTPAQKLAVKRVGTLEAYRMDGYVFNLLMDVKAGDVGPGEILIGLIAGRWEGGTSGDYDVNIDGIGTAEVKYLGPFAHSTNVPMGSAYKKRITNTDFETLTTLVGDIVKKHPELLKKYLAPSEINYFLENTIDQIYVWDENLSTKSLRLIGRLIRNGELKKEPIFVKNNITFSRLKNAMESSLRASLGTAEHLMFLGEKTDPNEVGEMLGGQYYIMPKEDLRYYMFYRVYKNERIKIAPFTTEKDFFEKTINEDEEKDMPQRKQYENEFDEVSPKSWDPEHIFSEPGLEAWKDGEQKIEVVGEDGVIAYGLFVGKDLVSAIELKKPVGYNVPEGYTKAMRVTAVATKDEHKNKGYASKLYKFALKQHKLIFSDFEIYENAFKIWERIIPKIAYPYNYDIKDKSYDLFQPSVDNDGSIVFAAFDADVDRKTLPESKIT